MLQRDEQAEVVAGVSFRLYWCDLGSRCAAYRLALVVKVTVSETRDITWQLTRTLSHGELCV
jgi:hypothetical protein